MSLHDEFALIKNIQKTLGKASKRVLLPIGDDAAVAKPPKGNLVATIDTLVEGVHFDLLYTSPRELGHKALAVNLSDIAAMGANPLYAMVSVGLKQELSDYFVTELYQGIKLLAKEFNVDVIGGNTVQSPLAVMIDIAIIGETETGYFTRSGASIGDLIAVTGHLGTSAAGLNTLKFVGRDSLVEYPELVRSHLMPQPRVKESLALRKLKAVTSMIDISDGLARELHHLAESSHVGMWIDEEKLPVSMVTHRAGTLVGTDPSRWVLFGGEDYELLFTFSQNKLRSVQSLFGQLKTRCTIIGQVTSKSQGVKIRYRTGTEGKLVPQGWNHFVRRKRPASVQATS